MAQSLIPEQEQLLFQLVEASRKVPRTQQTFELSHVGPGDIHLLTGAGIKLEVLKNDLWVLDNHHRLLTGAWFTDQPPRNIQVTQNGYEYYEARHPALMDPGNLALCATIGALDSERFKSLYPEAFSRWEASVRLLHSTSPPSEFTTVGHKIREALQQFSTRCVQAAEIEDQVIADPQKNLNRLRQVLAARKIELGQRNHELLTALMDYVSASTGLTQRLEHADQKPRDPATWEDAQAVVIHAGLAMAEFDRLVMANHTRKP